MARLRRDKELSAALRVTEAERMGFRRAIVPVGGSGGTPRTDVPGAAGDARRRGSTGRTPTVASASGGIEVVEVDDVAAAVQAALMD